MGRELKGADLTCRRIMACLEMVLAGDRMEAIIRLNTETGISVKVAKEILDAVCTARDDAFTEGGHIIRALRNKVDELNRRIDDAKG